MATQPDRRMTPEEYLAFERTSDIRHEYFDGFLIAMGGSSPNHNRINRNLIRTLDAQLTGRPCELFFVDIRVRLGAGSGYAYPDILVVCGTPEFERQDIDVLLNPTLIIEILSPSSERYDRGLKFAQYRQLPSLQDYVLVAQDRYSIERFSRKGTSWEMTEAREPDEHIELPSIGCTLNVRDVYNRIAFEPGASQIEL